MSSETMNDDRRSTKLGVAENGQPNNKKPFRCILVAAKKLTPVSKNTPEKKHACQMVFNSRRDQPEETHRGVGVRGDASKRNGAFLSTDSCC